MSYQGPIRFSYDGIDGPQRLGTGSQAVQKGNDRFFVGNGYIYAREAAGMQELTQFLRFLFKKKIFIIPQSGMNLGRIAVAQLSAKQSAFHQTTSV